MNSPASQTLKKIKSLFQEGLGLYSEVKMTQLQLQGQSQELQRQQIEVIERDVEPLPIKPVIEQRAGRVKIGRVEVDQNSLMYGIGFALLALVAYKAVK